MANVSSFDLDNNAGGLNEAISYTEGDGPEWLARNASVRATGNFNGQTLTISGLLAEDRIGFAGGVTIAGNKILIGGAKIGTFEGGTGGTNFVVTFTSNAFASQVQTLIKNLTYIDTSDSPTPNHTLSLNLAGTTRHDAVTVKPVNDAPVVDLNGAGGGTSALLSHKEGDAPKLIAPSAIISDIDSPNFDGGSLRVKFESNGASSDQLTILTDGAVSLNGSTVLVGGIAIGTVSGGANGSKLVVTFNSSATASRVTTLAEHIAYSNTSDTPSTDTRSVSFRVIDGDGQSRGGDDRTTAYATINVKALNDAPVVDLNGAGSGTSTAISYSAGNPLTKIAPAGTVSDVDSANFDNGSLRVSFSQNGTATDRLAISTDSTVTLTNGGTTVRVNGTAIGTVSGGKNGSDLVVTFTNDNATLARVKILLEHIGYQNTSGSPSTLPRAVTFALNDGDGAANGGQNTGIAVATINFLSTNTAPLTNAGSGSGPEDAASIAVSLSGSDTNGSVASFRIASLPLNGKLYANALLTVPLALDGSIGASGNAATVYFVPYADWNGETTFQYTSVDDGGLQDATPAMATITVTPANDAPTTDDVLINTNQNTSIIGNLGAADIDIDDAVTFSVEVNPQHGTLDLLPEGSYTYTPDADYAGSDSFTFRATDSGGLFVTGAAGITVVGPSSAQLQRLTVADEAVHATNPIGVGKSAVASLADGGHLVVWSSYGQTPDSSEWGVFAQRYDEAGEKVGTEFLVNTYTSLTQFSPSAAGLPDGGFVVTWESYDQSPDSSLGGIFGQRFDASGNKTGGEFLINQTTIDGQLESSVSVLANGNIVVTWSGFHSGGNDSEIYARIFTPGAGGMTAVTGEFAVNTGLGGYQSTSSETVAGLAGGRFAVVWDDNSGQDGSGPGVFLRVYEADGTAVNVSQVQINTTTEGEQYQASVAALSDGSFVATWVSDDDSESGIFARRFDAGGNALGDDFQINTWTEGTQTAPKVSGFADGGFVVAWMSHRGDVSDTFDITGQRYDAAGNTVGGEFFINAATPGEDRYPALALRQDDALIATWTDNDQQTHQKIIEIFGPYASPKDLMGGPGNDSFLGSQVGDTLNGAGGDDRLDGLSGNDTIIGGAGNDTIFGGAGSDTFVFNLPSEGMDRISDFVTGLDKIEISATGFGGGLTAGGVAIVIDAANATSAFHAGPNGYFIFDNDGANAGTVYWDANGGSGADAIAIAQLLGAASLHSSDVILA